MLKQAVFVFFFFILTLQLTLAQVEVQYFYSSACPISTSLEPIKEEVKNFWKNYVKWYEYDFMENRKPFEEYAIFNFPVAIINCFNKSYRIERNEISTKLNATIEECFKCDGIFVLGKECVAGSVESKSCGKCGVSYRYCMNNCKFSQWSECKNEKECYPGEVEKRACEIGNCPGYQFRNCNSTCYWTDWSLCEKIDPACRETIVILPIPAKGEYKPHFEKGILSVLLIFTLFIISLISLRKVLEI
jgi:hypothetical protein